MTTFRRTIRTTTAALSVPVMKLTGWRFSKVHRHTEDAVYRWIDTVAANCWAGM